MALTQTGAGYQNQSELQRRDRMLGQALDDLASQIQAVGNQAKAPTKGSQAAPDAPTALSVSSAGGYASATIAHSGADASVNYTLQYSTSPTFANPIPVDLGTIPSFHGYLAGLTLYFRVAARYATSGLSTWVYFGSSASPTAISF